MKIKTTMFSKGEVMENDEWIGSGHIMLKKDQLTAVQVAQLQARKNDIGREIPETFFKDVFSKSRSNYYQTAIMASVCDSYGARATTCRLYRETDGNGALWLNEVYAAILGSSLHCYGTDVVTDVAGNALCARMAGIEDKLHLDDWNKVCELIQESEG